MVENEQALLGTFPNTYTFTKALAERSIQKRRGNLRVTIVRPSIIISNYDDPYPGWIDTLAAAGGLIMSVQVGLMRLLFASANSILDIIPCDFVSNQVIVQTAQTGLHPEPSLRIVHSCTTVKNPIYMSEVRQRALEYPQYNPWFAQMRTPMVHFIPERRCYETTTKITEQVPISIGKNLAKLAGNKKIEKQMDLLATVSQKMAQMQRIFYHFMQNTWYY